MSSVVLRTSESEVCRIRCGPPLQAFAMRWNYVVRQRHRWADDPAARKRQTMRLQRDLRSLGVTAKHLRRLKGIVEVSVPDSDTDQHWESRILPWEYVLAAATKPYRVDDAILVVRHLRTGRRKRTRTPKRLVVIETAPGGLARHFNFSAQRQLVTGGLQALDCETISVLENPTERQFGQEIQSVAPDIVHVTGFDNRSGRERLGGNLSGVRDGLYLADPSSEAKEYRAEVIARLLNRGSPNPLLVGLQCWDSAARLAPMTIHAGARSAIGFQHTFDEAVAEIFFLHFYRAYADSQWNILAAFCSGWESIAAYRPRIRGSSIVLWSADSLVSAAAEIGRECFGAAASKSPPRPLRSSVARSADPDQVRIRDLVQVSVRPHKQINYSSLHNGQSVFDQLTLRLNPNDDQRDAITQIDDLELEVQLHVGVDSYPFRSRLDLSTRTYRYDLADRVTLPLTGDVFREINERVQTSLFVDLRWHDQVLYRHTHSIWLAPMDQWTLDASQIGWLPSFVQPRDPAVARTIDVAQGYLQCLNDRVGAGFDGYQSYDGFASGLECWAGVDRQVRSIWAALLLGAKLRYINPPPSYADFTQRLRTPGETIGGGFGTCVDLAIVMASCLEWIEVHPVLFLLHGHVFVGYWKDVSAHRRFLDVVTEDLPAQTGESELPRDDGSQRWVSGPKTYAEIKGFVDRGELVPIETVALTTGKGFGAAIDEGRGHFYKKRSRAFRAMIDLVSARADDGVTPLPLRFSDHHVG
ncbi:hypothetical protein Mal15_66290 [Stieleria maiorica]|uniref:Uncharacterized protein n=1 Tax=Stieleria maiorica TaxID=2795974 RepID=A0A5B9MTZ2_9BACT|nr:hypothetical protein [Stieleria maiorica]QEG02508.1 hypothetical protein Mal15_66290 [Stieleria maiorica]